MIRLSFLLGLFLSTIAVSSAPAQSVLVEAESFKNHGGWSLDTQFIEIMGSPYLLAHGLGNPVDDATTTVAFPKHGEYKVFVRTKDWVARWKAPGTPGRFQLAVDGVVLKATFGTTGADWHWQEGGKVEINKDEVELSLHDLTGFEGRCDAIAFIGPGEKMPPDGIEELAGWRRTALGLPKEPKSIGPYDLVVVGGGYSGLGSAIAATRMGLKVALIQNRPVLGGNGSSEVRVWSKGLIRRGKYPRIGEIVQEFADTATASPGRYEEFGDDLKLQVVRSEPNLSLFLNHHAFEVDMKGEEIAAVIAFDTRTSQVRRFEGKFFADCTGHGTIGALAEAAYDMTETGHMGMSNMWRWEDTGQKVSFPDVPWALELDMKDFPYPNRGLGEWFWEGGFDRDPLVDLEYTRDWNFRAVYGAFNAMKNRDGAAEHENASLQWIAFIGGPRESRRLMGDLLLTRDDIISKKVFPDGCVPSTWSIDLHYPKEQYAEKYREDPFISKAVHDRNVDRTHGYPIPYRCFYSKDVPNLFMAGRCISVTHEALGTTRVMRTCGMMGEVVGKAASVCVQRGCMPRDVYESYWDDLDDLLKQPGTARRLSVSAPIVIERQPLPRETIGISPDTIDGLVVDNGEAILTGKWTAGGGVKGFVGDDYAYASARAEATASYRFVVPKPGAYDIRVSYTPHANRASNASFTVVHRGGEETILVNQKKLPETALVFHSLGTFPIEKDGRVDVTTADADGTVTIDSVWVVEKK